MDFLKYIAALWTTNDAKSQMLSCISNVARQPKANPVSLSLTVRTSPTFNAVHVTGGRAAFVVTKRQFSFIERPEIERAEN